MNIGVGQAARYKPIISSEERVKASFHNVRAQELYALHILTPRLGNVKAKLFHFSHSTSLIKKSS